MSKGLPIVSLRLPPEVRDWYTERANAQLETLSVYLRRQLIAFYERSVGADPTTLGVSTPEPVSTPSVVPAYTPLSGPVGMPHAACQHLSSRANALGLRTCNECHFVRGMDGVWRP